MLFTSFSVREEAHPYFSPIDLEIDLQTGQIFVAGRTAKEVRSYSLRDFSSFVSFSTDLPPKALKVIGDHLLIACSYSEGELILLNKHTLQLESRIRVGHGACDMEISPDSSKVYVANQFSNDISVLDLHLKKETGRIPVLRQPKQLCISEDGHYLFVANFLPAGRADVDTVSSEVTVIDLQTEKPLKHIPLVSGSNALRGMCMSADNHFVMITHNLGRFQLPTTQLEQGWMNTSALSIIDAQSLEFVACVLLDESEYGAAGSWGVDCDRDYIYVAHSGTHDFSRIDYRAFRQKLLSHPDKNSLAYDLTFLSGIRDRIKVRGNGPRSLKAHGKHLVLGNYFSDNLSIVDLSQAGLSQTEVELMPQTTVDQVRLGETYFHDASYCFQHWQSCTGCHPDDARIDGLNWDLLNDGMGNPKNCKSLLLSHETAPSMVSGIRPDAETAVRSGFEYIQFMRVDEKVSTAVDAYLKSLEAIPSPHLINGSLSDRALQGKVIFEREGCKLCHPGPLYTDHKLHTMGLPGEFDRKNTWDTPSLIEGWRTGPYLHDGRCATMKEVFTVEKHGIENELPLSEIEQLVSYVLSL